MPIRKPKFLLVRPRPAHLWLRTDNIILLVHPYPYPFPAHPKRLHRISFSEVILSIYLFIYLYSHLLSIDNMPMIKDRILELCIMGERGVAYCVEAR